MTTPIILENVKRFHPTRPQSFSLGSIFIDSKGDSHFCTEGDVKQLQQQHDNALHYHFAGKGAFIPGFFETHIHGAADFNFSTDYQDKDAIRKMRQALITLGKSGVTHVMPTLISLDFPELKQCLSMINRYVLEEKELQTPGAAIVMGVHLEGPYIAATCKGSHDGELLQKIAQTGFQLETFLEVLAAAPDIAHWKVTFDPSLPNMQVFLRAVKQGWYRDNGSAIHVYPFIGHCHPSSAVLTAALDTGVIRGFTHLGNAMGESAQRCHEEVLEQYIASNVVKAALTYADQHKYAHFYAELIVDEVHLSSAFIKYVVNRLGKQRIILVTDALGYTADGLHTLGNISIVKANNAFWIAGTNTLAGSAACFDKVVQRYFKLCHADMQAVVLAAVVNPRHALADVTPMLYHDRRNYVVLDEDCHMILSACQGNVYFHSEFDEKVFLEREINFDK